MIIQHYNIEVRAASGPVYTGETYFGFFSPESLAQQVGVREARPYECTADEADEGSSFAYPLDAPFPVAACGMVDRVDLYLPRGGSHGLGFIRGSKTIDPAEWFFQAHFVGDPVLARLGIEASLQLMKVAAAEALRHRPRHAVRDRPEPHRWIYRGQVIPTNKQVTVEATIVAVDDGTALIRADGLLSVDGRVIYQMNDFVLRLRGE